MIGLFHRSPSRRRVLFSARTPGLVLRVVAIAGLGFAELGASSAAAPEARAGVLTAPPVKDQATTNARQETVDERPRLRQWLDEYLAIRSRLYDLHQRQRRVWNRVESERKKRDASLFDPMRPRRIENLMRQLARTTDEEVSASIRLDRIHSQLAARRQLSLRMAAQRRGELDESLRALPADGKSRLAEVRRQIGFLEQAMRQIGAPPGQRSTRERFNLEALRRRIDWAGGMVDRLIDLCALDVSDAQLLLELIDILDQDDGRAPGLSDEPAPADGVSL